MRLLGADYGFIYMFCSKHCMKKKEDKIVFQPNEARISCFKGERDGKKKRGKNNAFDSFDQLNGQIFGENSYIKKYYRLYYSREKNKKMKITKKYRKENDTRKMTNRRQSRRNKEKKGKYLKVKKVERKRKMRYWQESNEGKVNKGNEEDKKKEERKER